jgi:ribonucleoside-diphosphate reductase beta chain
MYLSRQLYEEAVHVQFYLTLLDTYIPEHHEREQAFAAIENIPSIKTKGEFCMKWIDTIQDLDSLQTADDRRKFLLNLICFATCIEGLFFFAAFAYVYFLRSKGLLHGLAAGTNWVFRDESAHMSFALEVVNKVRNEEPELFDHDLEQQIVKMLDEAVTCEMQFADDILSGGVAGLSVADMRQYLEFVADQRLVSINQNVRLRHAADLVRMLAVRLPNEFHTGALAELCGIRRHVAQRIAYCLRKMNAVEHIGKQGNALLYKLPNRRATKRATPAA